MKIILSKYGNIISTDDTSSRILKDIESNLEKEKTIVLDASGVVISTKSARLIFGYLYKKLTKFYFNSKIQFVNASPTFMFAVNEGIVTELEV